jgi:photosystem II stability/assembly factor-like uncharacterized protein
MIRTNAIRWVLVVVAVLATLKPVSAHAQDGGGPFFVLAVAPTTPSTIYAGRQGVWKSGDGGATWNVTGLTDREQYSLAIDPLTPTTIYAGRNGAIAKSTDAGVSWTSVPTVGDVYGLLIDPASPNTLYANSPTGGVLKSTDSGASWLPIGMAINGLVIDASRPTNLYAMAAGGECCTVVKSTDGGASWTERGTVNVMANAFLVADPVTPGTLYAGGDLGLFKSIDDGGNWVAAGPVVRSLVIDPLNPMILHAARTDYDCFWLWGEYQCFVTSFIFKSTDGATSWTQVATFDDGLAILTLAIDPLTPTTLYAAGIGLVKSSDGGMTWSTPEAPPPPAQFILSLSTVGSGTITASPAPVTGTYAAGTIVSLTATPAAGYQFSGWLGACSGSGACSVTMDAAKSLTATFAALPLTDTTAPETSITAVVDGTGTAIGDGAVTLSTALTLSFVGTDNVGLARFECRLDGAGFSTCASPLAYNALALGRHTFEVRAVDTSNNVDATPARYTWTVDAAPDTTISSAVDGRGKSIANGGSTPSDGVTFRFAGTDNGTIVGFECRLDAGNFTSCASPRTYTGIARGSHTFEVRAVDNSGFRDLSPAAFNWRR